MRKHIFLILCLVLASVHLSYSACASTCASGKFCDKGDVCTLCKVPNCGNCGDKDVWDGHNDGESCTCSSTCSDNEFCGFDVTNGADCKNCLDSTNCKVCGDKDVYDGSNAGATCTICTGTTCLEDDGTCSDIAVNATHCIANPTTSCTPILLKYCRTPSTQICIDLQADGYCQDTTTQACIEIDSTTITPRCALCSTGPDTCTQCLENHCNDVEDENCLLIREDIARCIKPDYTCQLLDDPPKQYVRLETSLQCLEVKDDNLPNKCLEAKVKDAGHVCTYCEKTHCANETDNTCYDIKNDDTQCKDDIVRTCRQVGNDLCRVHKTAVCKRLLQDAKCRDEDDDNRCYDALEDPGTLYHCKVCPSGNTCSACLFSYCFETTQGSGCISIDEDMTKCMIKTDGVTKGNCQDKTASNCRDSTDYSCIDYTATSSGCSVCTDSGGGHVCDRCDPNFCLKDDSGDKVCEDITSNPLRCWDASDSFQCKDKTETECRDEDTKECKTSTEISVQENCDLCKYSDGYKCTKCNPQRCINGGECEDITTDLNKCTSKSDWTCVARDPPNTCRDNESKECYAITANPVDVPIANCLQCTIDSPNSCVKCNAKYCLNSGTGVCDSLAADPTRCIDPSTGNCSPNDATHCRDSLTLQCVGTAEKSLPENCEFCVEDTDTPGTYTCPKCSVPFCMTDQTLCLNILDDGTKCVDPSTFLCTDRAVKTVCRDSVTLLCQVSADRSVSLYCENCFIELVPEEPTTNICVKCSDNYCVDIDANAGQCLDITNKDTLKCADPSNHKCKLKLDTECRDSVTKVCMVSADVSVQQYCTDCTGTGATYACDFCDQEYCLPEDDKTTCEHIKLVQTKCVNSTDGQCTPTTPDLCRDDSTYRCVDTVNFVFSNCDIAKSLGGGQYDCFHCSDGFCLTTDKECLDISQESKVCGDIADDTKCKDYLADPGNPIITIGRDSKSFNCIDGSDAAVSNPTFINCDLCAIPENNDNKYQCISCQVDSCYDAIEKLCPIVDTSPDICTATNKDCLTMALWDGVCRDVTTGNTQHECIPEEKNFLLKCKFCNTTGGLYFCTECFESQCLNDNGDCIPLGDGYCNSAGKCSLISIPDKICRDKNNLGCVDYKSESYTNCLECSGAGPIVCDLCMEGYCVKDSKCWDMAAEDFCLSDGVNCAPVSETQCRDTYTGNCNDYSTIESMSKCDVCSKDYLTDIMKCTGCNGLLCLNLTTGLCDDIATETLKCKAGGMCLVMGEGDYLAREAKTFQCLPEGAALGHCGVTEDKKCTVCEEGYTLSADGGCQATAVGGGGEEVKEVPLPSQEEDLTILELTFDHAPSLRVANVGLMLIIALLLGA